jgi:hypothetical protein
MKKIVFGALLCSPLFGFGQELVTDMETRVTYRTQVVNYERGTGFVIADDLIVDESEANAIGGRLYTGPAERVYTGPFGESGMSMKICHNTSNWPCMWVRQER